MISFCVTTFNRYSYTTRCVNSIINDQRVNEIVISDDQSNDGSFQELISHYKNDNKVKLHQNETNKDCYVNKRISVEQSSSPWVILGDSDNIFGSDYIERLFEIEKWEPDTIYAPVFAKPHFDYREFSGLTVTKENVSSLMDRPMFSTALNTANYLVCRDTYLSCWDGSTDPITADTIFHNYNHLKAGGKIKFVPGLEYEHTVHPLSHYKQNAHRSGHLHMQIEQQLRNLK